MSAVALLKTTEGKHHTYNFILPPLLVHFILGFEEE